MKVKALKDFWGDGNLHLDGEVFDVHDDARVAEWVRDGLVISGTLAQVQSQLADLGNAQVEAEVAALAVAVLAQAQAKKKR